MLRITASRTIKTLTIGYLLLCSSHLALAQEEAAPEPAPAESSSSGESAAQEYASLGEPLIVNVLSNDSIHFLQVAVEFKLKTSAMGEVVQFHAPAIKHQLIMLFSEKKYFEMQSIDGKKKMRDEALKSVQNLLKEKTGDITIENIFFTSLVVQ